MAGILNYTRYLETLQTLTELGNTFPSNQTTLRYYVSTPGTTDGWTATISWATLIIDQYTLNSQNQPDFTNSLVYGYYTGGTATEYSTGTISLPQYMYTGPILPASLVNLPVTVVNISWIKDQMTYDVNLALIQNWEPGVTIADPRAGIDFIPIDLISSTLTLTGPSLSIRGSTSTFNLISDIPEDITGTAANLWIYPSTLLANSSFNINTAEFTVNTALLSTGTYTLIASFPGYRNYGAQVSNTLSWTIVQGRQIVRDFEIFDPQLDRYQTATTFSYTLGVVGQPDVAPITTTSRVFILGYQSQSQQVYNDRFYSSQLTATITVPVSFVDTGLTSATTYSTLTSWTTNTTLYTATYLVSNTATIRTDWDYQTDGQYQAGSISTLTQFSAVLTNTSLIKDLLLTVSVNSSTIYGNLVEITANTTSTPYFDQIDFFFKEQTSATYTLIHSENASGSTSFNFIHTVSSTGTYSLYASYPGDFGQDIFIANRSTETAVTSFYLDIYNRLPVKLQLRKIDNQLTMIVSATTTATLINDVSFYNTSTLLGTASWVRNISTGSATIVTTQTALSSQPPYAVFGSDLTMANIYGEPGSLQNVTAQLNNSLVNQTFKMTNTLNWTFQTSTSSYNTGTLVNDLKPWYDFLGRRQGVSTPSNPRGLDDATLASLRGTDAYCSIVNFSEYQKGQLPGNPDSGLLRPQTAYKAWANKSLQIINNNSIGQTNPNRYRAWKYYDGTNYNLLGSGTQTGFENALDPISTGTWQAIEKRDRTFFYNDGSSPWTLDLDLYNTGDAFSRNFRLANNSTVYFDSNNPALPQKTGYIFKEYDISKIDTIGDSRGYNVVSLSGQASTGTKITFTSTLYGSHTITIEEYIGSTGTFYYHRFSPEVRQADINTFKSVLPWDQHIASLPAITYGQPNGRASVIPISQVGIFRMPSDAAYFPGQYCRSEFYPNSQETRLNYGRLQWQTQNNTSEERNYVNFCNAWYETFITNKPNVTPMVISTITTTTVTDNWTAAISGISSSTLSLLGDFAAAWSGTPGQPEYGDYGNFYITQNLVNPYPTVRLRNVTDTADVTTITNALPGRFIIESTLNTPLASALQLYTYPPNTLRNAIASTTTWGRSDIIVYPFDLTKVGSGPINNAFAISLTRNNEFFPWLANDYTKTSEVLYFNSEDPATIPEPPPTPITGQLGNFPVLSTDTSLSFTLGSEIVELRFDFTITFPSIGSSPGIFDLDQFARVYYTRNGYSTWRDFQLYFDWTKNILNASSPRRIQATRSGGFDTITFVDLRGGQPFFWLPSYWYGSGTATITRVELRATLTGVTWSVPYPLFESTNITNYRLRKLSIPT